MSLMNPTDNHPKLSLIMGYLKKFQWEPKIVEENEQGYHLVLVANIEIKEIDIHIKFSEQGRWIYFSSLFISKITKNFEEIYQKLLEFNYETTLTKFGIDKNKAVYALIEFPISDLDYTEFQSALKRIVNDINRFMKPTSQLLKNGKS